MLRKTLLVVILCVATTLVLSCKKTGDMPKMEAVSSSASYDADAFYNMIVGKGRVEVEAKLGKPYAVEQEGETESLYYDIKITDKHGTAYSPKIQIDASQKAVAVVLMPYGSRPENEQ